MTRLDAGLFAIDWSRTVTDEVEGLPHAALRPGSEWRWHGPATRLDGAPGVLPLGTPIGRTRLRDRVRRRAQRLAAGKGRRLLACDADPDPEATNRFSVTDGRAMWEGDWMPGGSDRGLLVFDEGLPPEASTLWIVAPGAFPPPLGQSRPLLPAGFVSGTPIATPLGPRPVEELRPGDAVLGEDGSVNRVLATVGRRVSAEQIAARPELRPIRVERPGTGPTALFLAPGQRLRLTGPGVEALFGRGPTLGVAADLVGLPDVSVTRWSGAVGYYSLTVPGAALVAAAGLWCEPLAPTRAGEAEVHDLVPDRRLLTAPEAALLAAAP